MTPKDATDLINNGEFGSIDEFRVSVEIGGWYFYTEKARRDTVLIILEDLPDDTKIYSVEKDRAWRWEEL